MPILVLLLAIGGALGQVLPSVSVDSSGTMIVANPGGRVEITSASDVVLNGVSVSSLVQRLEQLEAALNFGLTTNNTNPNAFFMTGETRTFSRSDAQQAKDQHWGASTPAWNDWHYANQAAYAGCRLLHGPRFTGGFVTDMNPSPHDSSGVSALCFGNPWRT